MKNGKKYVRIKKRKEEPVKISKAMNDLSKYCFRNVAKETEKPMKEDMKLLPATPKTLEKAIENALLEFDCDSDTYMIGEIKKHVADFIRQKITPLKMRGSLEVGKALEALERKLGI